LEKGFHASEMETGTMIKFNDQLTMTKFNFQGKNSWNSINLRGFRESAEGTPCNSPAFQSWASKRYG
jgi:hypothetical protein